MQAKTRTNRGLIEEWVWKTNLDTIDFNTGFDHEKRYLLVGTSSEWFGEDLSFPTTNNF